MKSCCNEGNNMKETPTDIPPSTPVHHLPLLPFYISTGLRLPLQSVCQQWITGRYLQGHRTFKTRVALLTRSANECGFSSHVVAWRHTLGVINNRAKSVKMKDWGLPLALMWGVNKLLIYRGIFVSENMCICKYAKTQPTNSFRAKMFL